MKITSRISALAVLLLCATIQHSSFGQGVVVFANFVNSAVTNIVTNERVPAGHEYLAQLFYAPIETAQEHVEDLMIPLGSPIGFYAPGLFNGQTRITPATTPSGGIAYFQVRVWQSSSGITYDKAAAAWRAGTNANILLGLSEVFTLDTAEDMPFDIPPTLPRDLPGIYVRPFVPEQNHPPEAVPQIANGVENSDLIITLSGTDADGDTLTARVLTFPAVGSLYQYDNGVRGAALDASGAITDSQHRLIFAPAPNQSGSPYTSFDFVVADQEHTSTPAKVVVHVSSVNEGPVADGSLSPVSSFPDGGGNLVVISPNGSDAVLHIDASSSADADGDSLLYATVVDGVASAWSPAPQLSLVLPVGVHSVDLMVTDGQAVAQERFAVQVFRAQDVIDVLLELLDPAVLARKAEVILPQQLRSARIALDAGNFNDAVFRLHYFQKRVRQFVRNEDDLAAVLTDGAQVIIDAVTAP